MQITDYMGVVFPLVGLPLLDCYHFDGFEGNANISVAIKSGSTVNIISLQPLIAYGTEGWVIWWNNSSTSTKQNNQQLEYKRETNVYNKHQNKFMVTVSNYH